jgi:2-phosphosulfolactate phosphatase
VPRRLRGADSAAMFFDQACDWAPQRDFELCTQVDVFDFVLRLERGEAPERLGRIEVPK